jgi:MFS family permease
MVLGFLGYIASEVLLITAPDQGYLFLVVSAFLEACSFAVISPLVGEMTVLTIDPKERARIQSILYVGVILLTAPFGWIAGTLSGLDKNLPFILNIVLFGIGALLVYLAGRASHKRPASEAATV